MSTELIKLEDVTKSYQAAQSIDVLKGIDLTVEKGESIAVVGPSGSGKSTLLNLIGTLDQPSSRKIIFDGQDIYQLKEKDRARLRNRQIGFVFNPIICCRNARLWKTS